MYKSNSLAQWMLLQRYMIEWFISHNYVCLISKLGYITARICMCNPFWNIHFEPKTAHNKGHWSTWSCQYNFLLFHFSTGNTKSLRFIYFCFWQKMHCSKHLSTSLNNLINTCLMHLDINANLDWHVFIEVLVYFVIIFWTNKVI